MIQVSIEVVVSRSRQRQFLNVLQLFVEPIRVEAGCIRCTVWKSTIDKRRLRFITEWQSPEDLDRYLTSSRFRAILIASELSIEAPIFEIHTISNPHGFEYVADLLGSESSVKTIGGSDRFSIPNRSKRRAE